MKCTLLIISVVLISCGTKRDDAAGRAAATAEMQQKVAAVIAQLKADCDSNLYELAHQKADSIKLAERKKKPR
jgi:hypothetical protein